MIFRKDNIIQDIATVKNEKRRNKKKEKEKGKGIKKNDYMIICILDVSHYILNSYLCLLCICKLSYSKYVLVVTTWSTRFNLAIKFKHKKFTNNVLRLLGVKSRKLYSVNLFWR